MGLATLIVCVFAAVVAQGDSTTQGPRSNNTCGNVTYVVQSLYKVYGIPTQGNAASDGTGPRMSALEARLSVLENKYSELAATVNKPDLKQQMCKVGNIHNITDTRGKYPTDCFVLFRMGYRCTGKYFIKPDDAASPVLVFCELSNRGWTYIMQRRDGSVNFYQNWQAYKRGFGSIDADYWLGNEAVHLLTKKNSYHLRLEAVRWSDNVHFIQDYSSFRLDSEASNYTLHVTGYSGLGGDKLSYHSGQMFSTFDRDNDHDGRRHCAQIFYGAGWYKDCYRANLFGRYSSECYDSKCISFQYFGVLKAITMKLSWPARQ